jgi:4-amino-4-deoxy-L-arabinose transferase-like glycosyltransferase
MEGILRQEIPPPGRALFGRLSFVALILAITIFHLWNITEIPRGFYCDELSIGYNAQLIAQSGHDEHAAFFPLYFRAFGDFKNPVYIYAVSLIYKIFGPSELGLRLTSFLFFFLLLLGFYTLVRDLIPSRVVSTYALLVVGFLPFFFTLSRVSFEVISQPALVVWSLLYIRRAYQPDSNQRLHPVLAGLFLGLSLYSYSTARLLTFFLYLSVVLIYRSRECWKKTALLSAAFFLTITPYVVYSLRNPDLLTHRFRMVSYLYAPDLSVAAKAVYFIKNYLSHFGMDFLLLRGDSNLRHATGYGGELFLVVFVLALAGLIVPAVQGSLLKDRFTLLMLVSLLLSPVAGSLTGMPGAGDIPHALRTVLLGLYFAFFSCRGMWYLQKLPKSALRLAVNAVVFAALLLQTSLYLKDYFTVYRDKSVAAFENYDFKSALALAIAQNPERIVVSGNANQPYVAVEFYQRLLANPRRIPISIGNAIPEKGCLVYFQWNEPLPGSASFRLRRLPLPGGVARVAVVEPTGL